MFDCIRTAFAAGFLAVMILGMCHEAIELFGLQNSQLWIGGFVTALTFLVCLVRELKE